MSLGAGGGIAVCEDGCWVDEDREGILTFCSVMVSLPGSWVAMAVVGAAASLVTGGEASAEPKSQRVSH